MEILCTKLNCTQTNKNVRYADLHVCYRRIKLNLVTQLMQCTGNGVIGRRYVNYIAAVTLAGQCQQLVGKKFKHCVICSPGLRVEGGHFQHLLVTCGKLCIIYFEEMQGCEACRSAFNRIPRRSRGQFCNIVGQRHETGLKHLVRQLMVIIGAVGAEFDF